MARDSAIPPESFDEILGWLHPDRDVAGTIYVQLRQDLTKIFTWNRCPDPDGLTDEVFDRVAESFRKDMPRYRAVNSSSAPCMLGLAESRLAPQEE